MLRPCGSYDNHLLAKALDHGGDLAVAFVWSCYTMLRVVFRRSLVLQLSSWHPFMLFLSCSANVDYNVTTCYNMLQHVTTYFNTFQYIQPWGPTCD
jgi:fumarate reductase subunit C